MLTRLLEEPGLYETLRARGLERAARYTWRGAAERLLAVAAGGARGVKVAIVHEWLETYAGSERVVEQLLEIWPEADLFAVCDFLPDSERGFLRAGRSAPASSSVCPSPRKHFRKYLGLMPLAIEQFDLAGYDLVVSSSMRSPRGC